MKATFLTIGSSHLSFSLSLISPSYSPPGPVWTDSFLASLPVDVSASPRDEVETTWPELASLRAVSYEIYGNEKFIDSISAIFNRVVSELA